MLTKQQARALLRLIEEHAQANLRVGSASVSSEEKFVEAVQESADVHRKLLNYLDELTEE